MIKKVIVFVLFIFLVNTIQSQTIFGKWYSFNEETKEKESIIEVYKKDGKAYAKIVDILNPERKTAKCDQCNGVLKDKPIIGMNILTGLKKKKDEWSGGKILDPKNGKEYKCYIKLLDKNTLKIRGYIGFSLLGRTAIWKRVNE